MKNRISATSLLFIALMAVFISSLFSLNVYATGTVLLSVAAFVPMPSGVLSMALQKEIWQKDIVDNLYKDNAFAMRAFNADSFVLAGKVVHIPVAGAPTVIKKNLTSFPQTAVNRTDAELTYALDTYYALPRQIQNIEKYELSYNKRQSVAGEDQKKLIQDSMEGLIYRWSPSSANVIETAGGASSADLIDGTATGSRKTFTRAAFKDAAKRFANANLNNGLLTALLTANHYYQFFESLSEAERTDVGRVADMATGKVGRYMGFDIFMRSSVARYRKVSGVWTVVDEQADDFAAGTDDSAASLFYVDFAVERAKGDEQVFDDNGNPLYYGDVFSANMRLGGRIRRSAGVYAVVEAIV